MGEAHLPPTNLWSNVGFDTLQFKSSYLPFSKVLPVDYQALCSKLTLTIVNTTNKLLLRTLILHDID